MIGKAFFFGGGHVEACFDHVTQEVSVEILTVDVGGVVAVGDRFGGFQFKGSGLGVSERLEVPFGLAFPEDEHFGKWVGCAFEGEVDVGAEEGRGAECCVVIEVENGGLHDGGMDLVEGFHREGERVGSGVECDGSFVVLSLNIFGIV